MSAVTSRARSTFRSSLTRVSTRPVSSRRTNHAPIRAYAADCTVDPGPGEAKLVRCANGAVFDVVVDARPGSASFGQVMTFLLDDQDCTQVYIPRGFLHGFQALD